MYRRHAASFRIRNTSIFFLLTHHKILEVKISFNKEEENNIISLGHYFTLEISSEPGKYSQPV